MTMNRCGCKRVGDGAKSFPFSVSSKSKLRRIRKPVVDGWMEDNTREK